MKLVVLSDKKIYRVKNALAFEIEKNETNEYNFDKCRELIHRVENEGKFIETVYSTLMI
jgi:hypothetical protein